MQKSICGNDKIIRACENCNWILTRNHENHCCGKPKYRYGISEIFKWFQLSTRKLIVISAYYLPVQWMLFVLPRMVILQDTCVYGGNKSGRNVRVRGVRSLVLMSPVKYRERFLRRSNHCARLTDWYSGASWRRWFNYRGINAVILHWKHVTRTIDEFIMRARSAKRVCARHIIMSTSRCQLLLAFVSANVMIIGSSRSEDRGFWDSENFRDRERQIYKTIKVPYCCLWTLKWALNSLNL